MLLEFARGEGPKHLPEPAILLFNILAIGSLISTISVADVVKCVDVLDARPLQLCKYCEASRTCPLAFNFSTPGRLWKACVDVLGIRYLLVVLVVLSHFSRCRFSERHLFHCDVLVPVCVRP